MDLDLNNDFCTPNNKCSDKCDTQKDDNDAKTTTSVHKEGLDNVMLTLLIKESQEIEKVDLYKNMVLMNRTAGVQGLFINQNAALGNFLKNIG